MANWLKWDLQISSSASGASRCKKMNYCPDVLKDQNILMLKFSLTCPFSHWSSPNGLQIGIILPCFDHYLAGVEVPSKDSVPKKRPIYEDKKKKKQQQQDNREGEHFVPKKGKQNPNSD